MLSETHVWTNALQAEMPQDGPFRRLFVVEETTSTQDAAKRLGAVAGDVVVAGRQTQGRGRLGRSWADTAAEGIAMTFVMDREETQRLAIAAAVAAALAAESLLGFAVGIKWPNDIIAKERKLAGVLIEQSGQLAYIGIGMNVLQRNWPEKLSPIAVSLAQLGSPSTRLEAMRALIRELGAALRMSVNDLAAAFRERDALIGRSVTFRSGGAIVSGIVREIDPLSGLVVESSGERTLHLSAATTSLIG